MLPGRLLKLLYLLFSNKQGIVWSCWHNLLINLSLATQRGVHNELRRTRRAIYCEAGRFTMHSWCAASTKPTLTGALAQFQPPPGNGTKPSRLRAKLSTSFEASLLQWLITATNDGNNNRAFSDRQRNKVKSTQRRISFPLDMRFDVVISCCRENNNGSNYCRTLLCSTSFPSTPIDFAKAGTRVFFWSFTWNPLRLLIAMFTTGG